MYVEISFLIIALVAILFFIAYTMPKEERDFVTMSASVIIMLFGLVLAFSPLEVKTGEQIIQDNSTQQEAKTITNVYSQINNALNFIISFVLILLGLAGVIGSVKSINENRWRRQEF